MTLINIKQAKMKEMYDYYQYLTQLTKNDSNITHSLTMYDDTQIYFLFFLHGKKRLFIFA